MTLICKFGRLRLQKSCKSRRTPTERVQGTSVLDRKSLWKRKRNRCCCSKRLKAYCPTEKKKKSELSQAAQAAQAPISSSSMFGGVRAAVGSMTHKHPLAPLVGCEAGASHCDSSIT